LSEIANALRLDPLNSRIRVYQGNVYRRLNQWTDAEAVYHRVLKDRPNYWPAYNELGWTLYNQGKYSEAADAFKAATLAAPGSALAYNNLGSMFLALGRFREASENFTKSVELKPNADAYSNAATALFASGKYAEASQLYKKALGVNPRDEEIWRNLGDSYSLTPGGQQQAQEAYARAAEEAERHLRTDPGDGAYWMKLALYRLLAGVPGDALSLVSKAEVLGGRDVPSQFTKAQVLEGLGRRNAALSVVEACMGRGLSDVEVSLIPNLRGLRSDRRYVAALGRATRKGNPQ
jgi:tetratricopeptide (TPR) repeat protein